MNSRKIMLGVALFAFCVQADTEIVDGVEWKFSGTDGKVTIEGIVGDLPESGKILVPSRLGGWPVCALRWGAFSNCKTLRSIEIPISVSKVGGWCFRDCENLETVVIAALINNLNDELFCGCQRLKTIKLPKEVLLIKDRRGQETVGSSAFSGCYSLDRIVLPDNVRHIYDGAFRNCYLLKDVQYPKLLQSVESLAFHQCYSLEEVALPDGVERMVGAFCRCTQLKNFIVPASVKEIDSSFEECFRLEKIVFLSAAPKGLPSHWFYGADVYCYADHAASYTKANPNLIVKSPRVPLKELCGVTFTNADNFVLLVDEKAAARAKANSKRWEELDAEASKALEEARKVSAEDCAQRVRDATRQEKEKQEARAKREAEAAKQKAERDAEEARQKAEREEQAQKREFALIELAGWPRGGDPSEGLLVYGTNIENTITMCCGSVPTGVVSYVGESAKIRLIPWCEDARRFVLVDLKSTVHQPRIWSAGQGLSFIEDLYDGSHWKKYDESGRLIKWGDRTKFEEYVWITNQHAVVSARLKKEWAKKHGLTLEQAEKRAEELMALAYPCNARRQPLLNRRSGLIGGDWRLRRAERRRKQAEADEAAAKREAERQAQAEAAKAQRDVEREQQRQQLLAIQEELKREAERHAQAEAAKAQRDAEREQQRQQLLAIQEELKRTREAKAAERK